MLSISCYLVAAARAKLMTPAHFKGPFLEAVKAASPKFCVRVQQCPNLKLLELPSAIGAKNGRSGWAGDPYDPWLLRDDSGPLPAFHDEYDQMQSCLPGLQIVFCGPGRMPHCHGSRRTEAAVIALTDDFCRIGGFEDIIQSIISQFTVYVPG